MMITFTLAQNLTRFLFDERGIENGTNKGICIHIIIVVLICICDRK